MLESPAALPGALVDDEAPIDEPEWFDEFCEALDELDLEDELELEAIVREVKTTVETLEHKHDQVELRPTEASRYRRAASNFLAVSTAMTIDRSSASLIGESSRELRSSLEERRHNARTALIKRRMKCSV